MTTKTSLKLNIAYKIIIITMLSFLMAFPFGFVAYYKSNAASIFAESYIFDLCLISSVVTGIIIFMLSSLLFLRKLFKASKTDKIIYIGLGICLLGPAAFNGVWTALYLNRSYMYASSMRRILDNKIIQISIKTDQQTREISDPSQITEIEKLFSTSKAYRANHDEVIKEGELKVLKADDRKLYLNWYIESNAPDNVIIQYLGTEKLEVKGLSSLLLPTTQ